MVAVTVSAEGCALLLIVLLTLLPYVRTSSRTLVSKFYVLWVRTRPTRGTYIRLNRGSLQSTSDYSQKLLVSTPLTHRHVLDTPSRAGRHHPRPPAQRPVHTSHLYPCAQIMATHRTIPLLAPPPSQLRHLRACQAAHPPDDYVPRGRGVHSVRGGDAEER